MNVGKLRRLSVGISWKYLDLRLSGDISCCARLDHDRSGLFLEQIEGTHHDIAKVSEDHSLRYDNDSRKRILEDFLQKKGSRRCAMKGRILHRARRDRATFINAYSVDAPLKAHWLPWNDRAVNANDNRWLADRLCTQPPASTLPPQLEHSITFRASATYA